MKRGTVEVDAAGRWSAFSAGRSSGAGITPLCLPRPTQPYRNLKVENGVNNVWRIFASQFKFAQVFEKD